MPRRTLIVVLVLLAGGAAHAGTLSIDELPCLPEEDNRAVRATVPEVPPGGSVRLYFRRLHPLGAFYFNRMRPAAAGEYWTVFPKPELRRQHELTDEWWEVLHTRDWIVLENRDREWLEGWLGEREQEAAEYYAAVYDASGALVERSDTRLVEVLERNGCPVELSELESGWARNLTVGETTELQNGKPLFHWLCDGVVTRIAATGILEPDVYCRACVVASIGRAGAPAGGRRAAP